MTGTDLIVFDYEGAQVRIVTGDDGEPWFVASDVARILGYREAHRLTRGLDDDERGPHIVGTPGGDHAMSPRSDPWESVPYTPTSSGSTRARQLTVFQAAVAARTRGLGGEDLRVALEEALAALDASVHAARQEA